MPTPQEMGLPNTYDLQRFQDIHLTDDELRKEYISKYQDGAINTAHSILNNNPQAQSKALTASRIKAYTDAIIDLERMTIQEGTETLDEMLKIFQDNIDNFELYDSWVIGQEYKTGNFVFDQFGNLYMALKDGAYDLTDTTAWLKLGLRGDPGNLGFGLNYRGPWDSEAEYGPRDMVVYQNGLYVAKTINKEITPGSSPPDWCVALTIEERGIFVSDKEPEDIRTGDYWWQIQKMIDWPPYPPAYIPTEDDFNVVHIKPMALTRWDSTFPWDFTSYLGDWPTTISFTLKNNKTGVETPYVATKRLGYYITNTSPNPLTGQERAIATYYCVLNGYYKKDDYDIILPDNLTNEFTSKYFPIFDTTNNIPKVESISTDKIQSYNLVEDYFVDYSAKALKEITDGFEPDKFLFSLPYAIGSMETKEYDIIQQNDKLYMEIDFAKAYGSETTRLFATNNTDLARYKDFITSSKEYGLEQPSLYLYNEWPFFTKDWSTQIPFNYVYMILGWTFPNTSPVSEATLTEWFNKAPSQIEIELIDEKTGTVQISSVVASKSETYGSYDKFTYYILYRADFDEIYNKYMVFPYYTDATLNTLGSYNLKPMSGYGIQVPVPQSWTDKSTTYSGYALGTVFPNENEETFNSIDIFYKHWVYSGEEASAWFNSLPETITLNPSQEGLYFRYYRNPNRETVSYEIPSVSKNLQNYPLSYPGMCVVSYHYNFPERLSGFHASISYGSAYTGMYQNNRFLEKYNGSYFKFELMDDGIIKDDEFNLVNIFPTNYGQHWASLNAVTASKIVQDLPNELDFVLRNRVTNTSITVKAKKRKYVDWFLQPETPWPGEVWACYYAILDKPLNKASYEVVYPQATKDILSSHGFTQENTSPSSHAEFEFGQVFNPDEDNDFYDVEIKSIIPNNQITDDSLKNGRATLNSHLLEMSPYSVKFTAHRELEILYKSWYPNVASVNKPNNTILTFDKLLSSAIYLTDFEGIYNTRIYNNITVSYDTTETSSQLTDEEFEALYNALPNTLTVNITAFEDKNDITHSYVLEKGEPEKTPIYARVFYTITIDQKLNTLDNIPYISESENTAIMGIGFRNGSFLLSFKKPFNQVEQLQSCGNNYAKIVTDSSFDVDAWWASLPASSWDDWYEISYFDEGTQNKQTTYLALEKGEMVVPEDRTVPYLITFTYNAIIQNPIQGYYIEAKDQNPTWLNSYGAWLVEYTNIVPIENEEPIEPPEEDKFNYVNLTFEKTITDPSVDIGQFLGSLPVMPNQSITFTNLNGEIEEYDVTLSNETAWADEPVEYPYKLTVFYGGPLGAICEGTDVQLTGNIANEFKTQYGLDLVSVSVSYQDDLEEELPPEEENPPEDYGNKFNYISLEFTRVFNDAKDVFQFAGTLPEFLEAKFTYIPEGETESETWPIWVDNSTSLSGGVTEYPYTLYVTFEGEQEAEFGGTDVQIDQNSIKDFCNNYGLTFESISVSYVNHEIIEPPDEPERFLFDSVEYHYIKYAPGITSEEKDSLYDSLPQTIGPGKITWTETPSSDEIIEVTFDLKKCRDFHDVEDDKMYVQYDTGYINTGGYCYNVNLYNELVENLLSEYGFTLSWSNVSAG